MDWLNLLSTDRLGSANDYEESFFASPFERDYYSIINSSHFRRLQGKTQVFTLESNDSVRNRLTHSIEVSSIAEILGKKLAACITADSAPEGVNAEQWQIAHEEVEIYENGEPGKFARDISMILRCAGLLHDIGNPPFGHSGEQYIREYFAEHIDQIDENTPGPITAQMYDDLINFEGNAQNLRIAISLGRGSLMKEYPNHGLALTTAVLSSLIKYPKSSEELANPLDRKGKIGFYHSEEFYFGLIAKNVGTLGDDGHVMKHPLMFLMEAADDIAYGTADIEDLLAMKLISWDVVRDILDEDEGKWFLDGKAKLQEIFFDKREKSMEEVVAEFINRYSEIMDGTYADELCNACSFDFDSFKTQRIEIYKSRDVKNEVMHHAKSNMYYIMDNLIEIAMISPEDRTDEQKTLFREIEPYVNKGQFEATIASKGETTLEQEQLYHLYLSVADFVSGMTDQYVEEFAHFIYDTLYE